MKRLAFLSISGHVANVDVVNIESNRKFCNKVWQAFRFCCPHWSENFTPLSLEKVRKFYLHTIIFSHCCVLDCSSYCSFIDISIRGKKLWTGTPVSGRNANDV